MGQLPPARIPKRLTSDNHLRNLRGPIAVGPGVRLKEPERSVSGGIDNSCGVVTPAAIFGVLAFTRLDEQSRIKRYPATFDATNESVGAGKLVRTNSTTADHNVTAGIRGDRGNEKVHRRVGKNARA